MLRWSVLSLLLSLALADLAMAQTIPPLRVVVRDAATGEPVAGVVLTLDGPAAGATTLLTTDAAGIATLAAWPASRVRIVGASDAQGQPLQLAANDPAGGLHLPLVAGQTQTLPLLAEAGRLIVEPVALADPAIVGEPAATVAVPTAVALSVGAVPAPAAVAASQEAQQGQTLFGWLLALLLGLPALIWAFRFAWRVAQVRRRRGAA